MFADALVLFDIDGTLIRNAGHHHRQALISAVKQATGMDTTNHTIATQGMLDCDILTIMLRNAGANRALIRSQMSMIVEHAQEIYAECCPDLTEKVCPGVRELLADLKNRSVPAALVTGNLTRIGWKKMEQAGLREFFLFGAFAEMASSRAGLVRLAIRHARKNGLIHPKSKISLIGDHPNDIAAAKKNGIQSIAVATGIASRSELSELRPDLLVDDLRSISLGPLL